MAYISEADLRVYVGNERGAVDSTLLLGACDAASIAIDRYCRRTFVVAGASSARTFAPNDQALLPIWDATAITSISEDGTALASTAWQAEPVGGLDESANTVPYSAVRRIDGNTWTGAYPGKASISITATWGWTATPYEVVEAARMVGKEIVDERWNRGGFVAFGDIAARAVRSRQVASLLDPLRSHRVYAVA